MPGAPGGDFAISTHRPRPHPRVRRPRGSRFCATACSRWVSSNGPQTIICGTLASLHSARTRGHATLPVRGDRLAAKSAAQGAPTTFPRV